MTDTTYSWNGESSAPWPPAPVNTAMPAFWGAALDRFDETVTVGDWMPQPPWIGGWIR